MNRSLLPYNRGRSPKVWLIVEGTPACVSIQYMDAEFDNGEVIARRTSRWTSLTREKSSRSALNECSSTCSPTFGTSSRQVMLNPHTSLLQRDVPHYPEFPRLVRTRRRWEVQIRLFIDRLHALTFLLFDNAHLQIDSETCYVNVDLRRGTSTKNPTTADFPHIDDLEYGTRRYTVAVAGTSGQSPQCYRRSLSGIVADSPVYRRYARSLEEALSDFGSLHSLDKSA